MNELQQEEYNNALFERYFIKNYGLSYSSLLEMPLYLLRLWRYLDEQENKKIEENNQWLSQQLRHDWNL
jgi:hypothetical protein